MAHTGLITELVIKFLFYAILIIWRMALYALQSLEGQYSAYNKLLILISLF